jgi:hypothetical protein
MDGQMFAAGNAALGQIAKKLKAKTIGGGVSPEQDRQAAGVKKATADAASAGNDAFWSGLNDMHPRSLGRRETITRLAAQKAGLSLVLLHAWAAAAELPEHEAAFLRDNLIYQSAIMVVTCHWLEQVELAHEALDLGDRAECIHALEQAAGVFAEIPDLAKNYCRGEWENWYRGCTKLNVSATLKRTDEVLDQARQE